MCGVAWPPTVLLMQKAVETPLSTAEGPKLQPGGPVALPPRPWWGLGAERRVGGIPRCQNCEWKMNRRLRETVVS